MSFHLFGQVVVVLNTAKAAKDLLDKRSAIYSDRPPTPIYEMYVLEFFCGFFGSRQSGWGGAGFWHSGEATNVGV